MTAPVLEGLECRVGLGRVVVPTEQIDVLGEYRVGARLPSTERVGVAIGAWGDRPVLSISLTLSAPAAVRSTAGVLLVARGPGMRCALEIGVPVGLVAVVALAAPPAVGVRWLRAATLADGRTVQYVDAGAMRAALEDPA
jgi:hypothetical protein